MTHCRECNSEIAEAEAFCPFCGISIERVEIAGTDTDPENAESEKGESADDAAPDFDRTIVTGPGGLSALTEATAAPEDQNSEEIEEADAGEDAAAVETPPDEISNAQSEQAEKTDAPVDAEAAHEDELKAAGEEEIERAVSVIDDGADVRTDESVETETPVADEEVIESSPEVEVEGEPIVEAAVHSDPAEDVNLDGAVESPGSGDVEVVADSDAEESEAVEVPDIPSDLAPEEEDPAGQVSDDLIDDADMEATLIAGSFDLGSGSAEIGSQKEDAPVADLEEDVEVEATVVGEPETSVAGSESEEPDPATVEAGTSTSEIAEKSNGDAESDSDITGEATPVEPDLEFSKDVETGHTPVALESSSAPNEAVEFLDADVVAPSESAAEASPEQAGDPAVSTDSGSVPEEDAPMTTPNIGGGDTDGSKTPKLRPLDEGTILNDRYEIVRKIGGGGMGAVYLASDKNLGGVLRAVKEMVQSYIEKEQQEKAVQDFKRESMLLTSLEHPSIPTIYDYFYDEKEARFYLVMKYISGGDLAAKLRAAPEGRLDEISVTQFALEIADVLSYLHNRQPPIVYRDLKPANIMIDGNTSRIMLIDFGIARWINKEEKGVTAVGTMGYAPPELFSGNVVPSSDIYSLGSTMFHLLTGADPQNNPLLIFDFQKHPRPRQINPNLSDQMERILMRAVEYNAEGRFASAAEMRDELQRHLDSLKQGQVSYGIKETPAAVALSDQPVFCGFCGQKIVATDMFCAFCGAKQPLAQPGVQSQEYVLPQTTARLVVEGTGDLSTPTFDLGKKENLVGRRDPMSNIFPEVDLSKYDPQTKISRKHARIWRDGEMYMLEDLGSSNGTMVIQANNDTTRLAPHQSRALNHGDKIQVGDTTLHFVIG